VKKLKSKVFSKSAVQWIMLTVIFGMSLPGFAAACSEVSLGGTNPVVSARTMDFAQNLYSRFVAVPANLKWKSFPPLGQFWKSGKEWTNQYAFVGVDTLDGFPFPFLIDPRMRYSDGINEMGLSASSLWLEDSRYNKTPETGKVLASIDIVGWILGSFATTQQVIDALNKEKPDVDPWKPSIYIPTYGWFEVPVHIAVHDAGGKSLVIEWLGGSAKPTLWYDDGATAADLVLTENTGKALQPTSAIRSKYVGVMTNDPMYRKQLKNLFSDPTPYTNQDTLVGGGYLEGGGLLKLPGDHDPRSRFVRLYHISNFSTQSSPGGGSTVDWRVAQAFRVIGQVDGIVGEQDAYFHEVFATLWTLVRDHTNLRLYFNGVRNQSVQVVDFKELKEKGLFTGSEPKPLNWLETPVNKMRVVEENIGGKSWGQPLAADGLLDLRIQVPVLAEDRQSKGRVYVYAKMSDGSFRNLLPDNSWVDLDANSQLTPCFTGLLSKLPATGIEIFKKADSTGWAGASIYAGYGKSFADMYMKGTYAMCYAFPAE